MSRNVTPPYRVEYSTSNGYITPGPWRGRATAKRLAAHVAHLQASFQPGGVNDHVGRAFPTMRIMAAVLIRQCDDRMVASVSYSPDGKPEERQVA